MGLAAVLALAVAPLLVRWDRARRREAAAQNIYPIW